MTHIVTRNSPQRAVWQLEQQGMHPLLARLYAARGVKDKTELDYELKSLIPPSALTTLPMPRKFSPTPSKPRQRC
jgi:single-stranded-DNA-specific exonuclease